MATFEHRLATFGHANLLPVVFQALPKSGFCCAITSFAVLIQVALC